MSLIIADTDRTEEEVEAEYEKAIGILGDNNQGKWPGMTYEQGVRDALAWIMGDEEEPPLAEHDG